MTRDLELYRVVLTCRNEGGGVYSMVRYEAGIDAEDAIDNVLRGFQIASGAYLEGVWAVPDEGIVTYAGKTLGNTRRGDPIPRQRDRTL